MKTALLILLSAPAAVLAAGTSCESLAATKLAHTTVGVAEVRTAGTPFRSRGIRPIADLPAFCRVAGVIAPTSDSEIRFELWLPLATDWNGKFQGVGNGGFAGTINFGGLADAVKNKYATASTDTGHEGATTEGTWALKHPEKIVDFGYRGIHETAVVAKDLIHAFYGEAPKRSYFNSCSNGGRQALMEAQRFPEDYDGILAGAPANYWTRLLAAGGSSQKALLAEAPSYIPASKLPAIQAAVQEQCDALDGVKDGVIENPTACKFDTSVLLCKGADSDSCLTTHQLTALNTLQAGLVDGKGKQIYPALSPGGEAEKGGWADWVTGTAPEKGTSFAFGTQFFKNFVYDNPDWNYKTFDVDRDLKAADDKLAKVLNSTDPDLSAFAKRGGKLILYHGWADAAIPPTNAIHYYDSVVTRMGAAKAAEFVRLYMVPGMQHCGGGNGPNYFGQLGTPNADRTRNIDAALEAWVEQGTAPESIIAIKFKGNDPKLGVERTRPLCTWPMTAKYKGTGSTDNAANFSCSK
jgi:feruloyl esterase